MSKDANWDCIAYWVYSNVWAGCPDQTLQLELVCNFHHDSCNVSSDNRYKHYYTKLYCICCVVQAMLSPWRQPLKVRLFSIRFALSQGIKETCDCVCWQLPALCLWRSFGASRSRCKDSLEFTGKMEWNTNCSVVYKWLVELLDVSLIPKPLSSHSLYAMMSSGGKKASWCH